MLIFFYYFFLSFLSLHESQKRKMERVCKEIEKRQRLKTVTSILESIFQVFYIPYFIKYNTLVGINCIILWSVEFSSALKVAFGPIESFLKKQTYYSSSLFRSCFSSYQEIVFQSVTVQSICALYAYRRDFTFSLILVLMLVVLYLRKVWTDKAPEI